MSLQRIGGYLVISAMIIIIFELLYASIIAIIDFYTPNFVYPINDLTNPELIGPILIILLVCGLVLITIGEIGNE